MLVSPCVSIVIPVYNGMSYLNRCIDSALAQSYHAFEVVIVDDGSSDETSNILCGYNGKIKAVYQPHLGVSAARNTGVRHSSGQLIAFVDADDWIAPEYLMDLVKLREKHQADISICGIKRTTREDSILLPQKTKTVCFTGVTALREMLYQSRFDTGLVGKLIPRNLLLQFPCPEGHIYEDFFVMYQILSMCRQVVYCSKQNYYYFQNAQSITHRASETQSMDQWLAAEKMYQFVSQNYPEMINAAICRKFSAASSMLLQANESVVTETDSSVYWDNICQNRWHVLRDRRARRKNRLAAFTSYFGQKCFIKIYKKYREWESVV